MAISTQIVDAAKSLINRLKSPTDLAGVSKMKDPKDVAKALWGRYSSEDKFIFWNLAFKWFMHDLFDLGIQKFRSYAASIDRLTTAVPPAEDEDLAVNNVYKEQADGFVSIMLKHPVGVEFQPLNADEEAINTRRVADAIWPLVEDMTGFEGRFRQKIHRAQFKYGSAFSYVYSEADETQPPRTVTEYQTVPKQLSGPEVSCDNCGFRMPVTEPPKISTCPQCGAPTLKFNPPIIVPESIPQQRQIPRFNLCAEVVPNYEVKMSCRSNGQPYSHYLIRERDMPVEMAQKMVPDESIGSGRSTNWPQLVESILRYTTGGTAASTFGLGYTTGQNLCKVVECWFDPVCYSGNEAVLREFPLGLYSLIVNEKVRVVKNENHRRRWTQFPANSLEGSPYGYGQDGILQRQQIINLLESIISEEIEFSSGPLFFDSNGLDITKVEFRAKNSYPINTMATNGNINNSITRPTLSSQIDLGSQLKYYEYVLQSVQMYTGVTPEALGRQVPGTATLGQAQLQMEAGMARFQPVMALSKGPFERVVKQLLQEIRENPQFEFIKMVMGKDGAYSQQVFQSKDLQTDVDVVVKIGTDRPLTYGEKLQAFQAGMQLHAIDLNDPLTKHYAEDLLGVQVSKSMYDGDRKAVYRNINLIREVLAGDKAINFIQVDPQSGKPALTDIPVHPVQFVDNNALRAAFYKEYVLSDEFQQETPFVQQAIMQLIQEHMQLFQQEQMAAQRIPPKTNINLQARSQFPQDQASQMVEQAMGVHSTEMDQALQTGQTTLATENAAKSMGAQAQMVQAAAKMKEAGVKEQAHGMAVDQQALDNARGIAKDVVEMSQPSPSEVKMAELGLRQRELAAKEKVQ